MPDRFRRTCRLLGDLYSDSGDWKNALLSYKDAIQAGDILYSSGLSVENKSIEVEASTNIYRNATLAAFRQGLITDALLIFERGKTRLLDESLQLKMKQPHGVPNDEWIKYEQAAEEYRAATKLSNRKEDYGQKEEAVQRFNSEFQKKLEVSDILSILDEETALLTFCIANEGSIGFVASRSKGIQSVDIPGFQIKDLNNLLFKPEGQELITGGWVGDYLSYCDASNDFNYCTYEYNKKESETDNEKKFEKVEKQFFEAERSLKDTFQIWKNTLNNILSSTVTTLLNPLIAELPPQIKKLIIFPSGGLFLLPLHAVPLSKDQLLCQSYCISYAPSVQLLREMQKKTKTVNEKDLYTVNPQEDPALVFSDYEIHNISRLFLRFQISAGETCTKPTVLDRIPGKGYLHFSCHGSYNWNDPLQSGLHLVGGRTLSLEDLQSDVVDMSSARLVTLSACETGITDIVKGSADEFVGLPAGFMLAGVPCVVSSLWSVPEISTAILMERFYCNHIVEGMDIPHALQKTQLYVRDLTAKQVVDYVEKCYHSGKWEGKSKERIEQYKEKYLKMAKESPDEKPFHHPYYWAAFTVNGA
jgi:CHAT domain-containing protein